MRYMEDDPFMRAASDLVEDIQLKAAEEEGRVYTPEAGLHFIGEDGQEEFIGSREDIADELAELYTKGFQEAYDQAYREALESFTDAPALGDEWGNFQYDED